MDLNQFLTFFTGQNLLSVTFKVLAIFFSVFYLLYGIILFKQTEVMNRTLETRGRKIFLIISSLQIFAGIILLILAIFFV